jgi:hypothetical protein
MIADVLARWPTTHYTLHTYLHLQIFATSVSPRVHNPPFSVATIIPLLTLYDIPERTLLITVADGGTDS